ncbi:photosystem II PsbY protein [Monoraphidium neglectum]|uniref:Photosystem II PsbY protein n=1 Tax=Monoraphidium neglectum TaxID=145388 RepID=A0A0D2M2Z1_9CHLO|nr:photosystem II PsbY protein [Monoraphidium neglectum]KIY97984.1 photosystem II PsbY protein [Monoraphidium neglectum]|eukprot:XP_013897004.1 photosystem II PsbY protein [Monoraphidium neglectum]
MALAVQRSLAGTRLSAPRAVPKLPSVRRSVRVQASASTNEQISKLLALPAAAGALLAAGNAQAATELAQLAATSDARLATIALLFVPAIGWVGFNMLGPLNNQLARMSENNAAPAPKAKAAKRRGVAGAVGLGAALSLAAAQQAEAASEVAQLAATDNRIGIIALLFLPAVGWVAFNILGPLTNQLSRMSEANAAPAPKAKPGKKKRGFAGAVGLGAALSLAAAQQAEAATEVAQLAASDNRIGIIALLFLPAVGWVAFNILGPLNNQLARMSENNAAPVAPTKKRR